MSCIQHLSVIVTGINKRKINKARNKAIDIFNKNMVTQIAKSDTNKYEYESFMICSSTVKAGGNQETKYENKIKELVNFLDNMAGDNKYDNSLQYVVISYGDYGCKINNTNQINKIYL